MFFQLCKCLKIHEISYNSKYFDSCSFSCANDSGCDFMKLEKRGESLKCFFVEVMQLIGQKFLLVLLNQMLIHVTACYFQHVGLFFSPENNHYTCWKNIII